MGKEEKKEDKPKTAIEKAGFKEEVAEDFNSANYGAYVKTGFPQPLRRYRLVYESQQASIEHTYFWVYNHTLQDMSFGDIIKTVDTFAASENSSFWGMTEQRKGIQQDKASQYLATIGRMVKELFQIVREIRILSERLVHYDGVMKGKQADDIALKGYWVDMVEGGTKGQANIYTMAQQLGFGTLPDLFFSVFVGDEDDIDKAVKEKAGEFNDKVKEVLRRKLASYVAWRKETYKELSTRKRFTLRYLRQHWAVIRMYMGWVKPYLRNVQKLSAPDKYDKNPELISSFEGAMMEIEFLAKKAASKGVHPVIIASFNYRVKPQLSFQADSYQNRGAVHVGRVEFSLRSYGWTQEQIDKYIKYREQETLELIEMVDSSVKDAMEALGKELMDYLKEAGEDVTFKEEPKKEEAKPPSQSIFEPFADIFGGFKELFVSPFGVGDLNFFKEDKKKDGLIGYGDKEQAKAANGPAFMVYKNYKKAHQMVSW
jgi:hypothetical protein